MPELPEVETICAELKHKLCGMTISNVECHRPNLRYDLPDLSSALEGRLVTNIERRAKYILIFFDNPEIVVICHLGMSGRFLFCPASKPLLKHDHVVFHFTTGNEQLRYYDPRRFGFFVLEKNSTLNDNKHLKSLGFDPFNEELTGYVLYQRLKGKNRSIKSVLMDQSLIAGLGNIYVSESLYWARIHPLTPASNLSEINCVDLLRSIRNVLNSAIKAGGSTLKDYRNSQGESGYFQNEWAVYDKQGQKCPDCMCDIDLSHGIQQSVIQGRSTYYCSFYQKKTA